jgi:cytochrome P450
MDAAYPEFDLGDPDLYFNGDPETVWDLLRRYEPVYWHPPATFDGFWAVTGYDEAVRVLRDTTNFSSASGIMLEVSGGTDTGGGMMLTVTDPPRHRQLRNAMNGGFRPGVIARLRERIEEIIEELLDDALEQGSCDFVGSVAAKLPNYVICELLGVPREDWDLMYRLTSTAFGFDDPELRTADSAEMTRRPAHTDIMLYYLELIHERRNKPQDDMVSALATAVVEGHPLTEDEVLVNCDSLIIGGNVTTRAAISGGLLALLEHDQWSVLRNNPRYLATAVEEVLRWTTPIMHHLRTVTNDVVLAGREIKAGDTLVVWTAAANRDDKVFADPQRFAVARDPNKHLAFGVGEHYCLGAPLARLEIEITFRALIRRVRRIEVAGPLRKLRSNVIRSINYMPVEIE